MVMGQERKHRGAVEERVLLGALFPGRGFSSCFRMDSVDRHEHSVTPEVLGVGFHLVF